ncbi:MAG: 4Fe-4S binding protein [Candidatus Omnitrophota bacterium]
MDKRFLNSLVFIAIIIMGWQYPLLGYFIPFCMLIGIIIGLSRGRKWCDWYCPRGSFYDTLMKPLSAGRGIPGLFKNIYFRIGVLIFLMLIMAINLILRWPNSYNIGRFFVFLLTITTAVGIVLAIIFHQRSWCSFCPIGTVINLISRGKEGLRINSELCVECKICFKACPMQIRPYLFKGEGIETVKDADCLRCGSCVASCPTKALALENKQKST